MTTQSTTVEQFASALDEVAKELETRGVTVTEHTADFIAAELDDYSIEHRAEFLGISDKPAISVWVAEKGGDYDDEDLDDDEEELLGDHVFLSDWGSDSARKMVDAIFEARDEDAKDRSVRVKAREVLADICYELERKGVEIRRVTGNFIASTGPAPDYVDFVFYATDHGDHHPASVSGEAHSSEGVIAEVKVEYKNWSEGSAKEMTELLLQSQSGTRP